MNWTKTPLLLTVLVVSSYVLAGCGQPSASPSKATANSEHQDRTGHVDGDEHHDGDGHDHAKGEHTHGEWWCAEHGVPEEVCALCDSKLAADFQKKGDWCKEHDRPDSQCFICHPELETKFAAQYEAKYGKKPPKPHVEEGEHDHDKEKSKT